MSDDLSQAEENSWCANQRRNVLAYLASQGLQSPSVGEWPAWYVAPIISVWAIESQRNPGQVGWWAVSGDCPTDYVTCGNERHPRQALRDIGTRWQQAAADWLVGKRSDDFSIGTAACERQLAPLLAKRAELFLEIADDEARWGE